MAATLPEPCQASEIYLPIPAYFLVGLGTPATGPLVLPSGSDGVTDFRAAASGNSWTPPTDVDVSHAESKVFGINLFGTPHYQTNSVDIARKVTQLLDGNGSEFGSFVAPQLLPASDRNTIDIVAKVNTFIANRIVRSILTSRSQTAQAASTSTSYTFQLLAADAHPISGTVNWTSEVFGANVSRRRE